MPRFEKLSVEEVSKLVGKKTSNRAKIRAEYDEYVSQFQVGDGHLIIIEPGEKRTTVRARILDAAERAGLVLEFKRVRGGDSLKFLVISGPDEDEGWDNDDESTEEGDDTNTEPNEVEYAVNDYAGVQHHERAYA